MCINASSVEHEACMYVFIYVVCIDIHVYTKEYTGQVFCKLYGSVDFFFDLRLVKVARIH